MKKWLVMAGFVLTTAAGAFAEPGGGPGMHDGKTHMMGEGRKHMHGKGGGYGMDFLHPRMLKKLDLSEEQMKKLKDQRLEVQKQRIELHAEKAKLELDLHHVFSAAPVKEAEAKKLAEKIAETDRKLLLLRVETMSRFLAGLTPEQHRKVMDYQADMRERRKAWREEMKKDWKRGEGDAGVGGD
jgi:Spy/CpxP family protein refolding chaperone